MTYTRFLIEYVSQVTRMFFAGIAQLARASAFQAEGCEFESHYPLHLKICNKSRKYKFATLYFYLYTGV